MTASQKQRSNNPQPCQTLKTYPTSLFKGEGFELFEAIKASHSD
jgi:hypothetical protein